MNHDVGGDLVTHYADPCCILSQNGSFVHPHLNVAFGPALCLVHLLDRGWMYSHRVYQDDGRWQSQSGGVSAPLAALNDAGARANLGMKLRYMSAAAGWDYYLEYVRPNEWNRGIGIPFVFIRSFRPVAGLGDTPIYLGALKIPQASSGTTEFIEPQGNVRFNVKRFGDNDRIVRVTATAL
jgi:hypothetical protein